MTVVDALAVAKQAGLAGRINTVTQACFFAISGVLPRDEAIAQIKKAIEKTYGKRGVAAVAVGAMCVALAIGAGALGTLVMAAGYFLVPALGLPGSLRAMASSARAHRATPTLCRQ